MPYNYHPLQQMTRPGSSAFTFFLEEVLSNALHSFVMSRLVAPQFTRECSGSWSKLKKMERELILATSAPSPEFHAIEPQLLKILVIDMSNLGSRPNQSRYRLFLELTYLITLLDSLF